MSQEDGLQNAAVLLMSLGEEEAAEVFKHLSPKEVQKLGEAIAKTRTITRVPSTRVTSSFRGAGGGPPITAPVVSNTPPWQGHSMQDVSAL